MQLGPFEILETLATGNAGVVYRARHTELGRIVAVKQIPVGQGRDAEQRRERCLKEAKLIAGVESEYVVRLYSHSVVDGQPVLEMEWIDGASVETLLQDGPRPLPECLQLANELLGGLAAIHQAGVLHRDIKPANIVQTADGHYKLVDFGVAGELGRQGTLQAGTLQYAAPEQVQSSAEIDGRADLYSAGLVVYEAVLGRPAMLDALQQAVGADPSVAQPQWLAWLTDDAQELPRLDRVRSDIPLELALWVARLTAKDPSHRFESVSAAREALAELQLGPQPSGSAPPVATADTPGASPTRGVPNLVWVGLVAGVLILAGGLTFLMRGVPSGIDGPATAQPTPEVAPEPPPEPAPEPAPELAAEPASDSPAPSGPVQFQGRLGETWIEIPGTNAPGQPWQATFTMGCVPADAQCETEEVPGHQVGLTVPFALMTTEATVGQYRRFVESTAHQGTADVAGTSFQWNGASWASTPGVTWREPGFVQDEQHPVVHVSWNDAAAFCSWLGGRLPSESEWEYAARGGDDGQIFVWGNGPQPATEAGQTANVADAAAVGATGTSTAFPGYDDGTAYTAAVASFVPNAFGLHDMAGNVWEWAEDRYGSDYYASASPVDPRGPSTGGTRVLRGGFWGSGPDELRVSARGFNLPDTTANGIGLRCARDVLP